MGVVKPPVAGRQLHPPRGSTRSRWQFRWAPASASNRAGSRLSARASGSIAQRESAARRSSAECSVAERPGPERVDECFAPLRESGAHEPLHVRQFALFDRGRIQRGDANERRFDLGNRKEAVGRQLHRLRENHRQPMQYGERSVVADPGRASRRVATSAWSMTDQSVSWLRRSRHRRSKGADAL